MEVEIVLEGVEPVKRVKKTSCQMTKYEYAALIIKRAEQITSGKSKPKIDIGSFDANDIAEEELRRGLIPFMIERKLPDGSIERWCVKDLIIADH